MQALDRVLSVVDLLQLRPELRLHEIAHELALPKSTAHRILGSLSERGFVQRDPSSHRFRLGPKFIELGMHVIENLDLSRTARSYVARLNDHTHETVHLATLVGDEVVYVDKRESQHAVRMYSFIGKRVPLYCTGAGKAILAFQDPSLRDHLIDQIEFLRYTPKTITSPDELREVLERIRKTGVAFDDEEHEKGIVCIAAPIRDYSNEVVASVSVRAVVSRVSLKDLAVYRGELLATTNDISLALGYSPTVNAAEVGP